MFHRRFPRVAAALSAALFALTVPAAARAQLTLTDALRRGDRAAFANRIAAGTADAQDAQTLAPLRGVLPDVHLEAGFIRTTDPVGAFGTTLRQRSITQNDFAPNRLNYPDAVGNYQGAIVVQQPLFNADAAFGRRAAVDAADASRASERWTSISTRVDVIRAYYGAVLAAERITTLDAASRAAHAHVAQAEAMVRQGLVTKSDALLASVRAADVDAQLVEARGAARSAVRGLAVLLGESPAGDGPTLGALPATLPDADRIRALVAVDTLDAAPVRTRADVRAATLGADAAHEDARRARSTFVPRVNSFARYDWNSLARPYAGDKNWTVGIMATWSLFAGAGDIADVRASSARADAARAGLDAARAQAQLDAQDTRTALSVALERLAIAERAVGQSSEAHRLVARKYDGGLATVVELLDAQAAETQTVLALSQARYGAIVADAARRRSIGEDPAALAALDSSTVTATATSSR